MQCSYNRCSRLGQALCKDGIWALCSTGGSPHKPRRLWSSWRSGQLRYLLQHFNSYSCSSRPPTCNGCKHWLLTRRSKEPLNKRGRDLHVHRNPVVDNTFPSFRSKQGRRPAGSQVAGDSLPRFRHPSPGNGEAACKDGVPGCAATYVKSSQSRGCGGARHHAISNSTTQEWTTVEAAGLLGHTAVGGHLELQSGEEQNDNGDRADETWALKCRPCKGSLRTISL